MAAERRTINDVVLCQYCRKKFQTSNAQMHKINHGIDCEMFCSKSCADNAHRERMIKDGNPNWKGGAEVYTAEFKKVIGPKVKKKDGGKCVVCGSRRQLVCHHIDENPRNNDLKNLVTLCRKDHSVLHKSNQNPFGWLKKYAERRESQFMISK